MIKIQGFYITSKMLVIAMMILFCGIGNAQERKTKETKIILAVNEKSDAVEHIDLLVNFQKIKKEQLKEKYNRHKFFLGVLKGTYLPSENGITLGGNTTIIMYTDKEFSPPGDFFKAEDITPGDEFNLGKTKAKVIANTKGELVVKTQN